jgi:hypothetical protein
VDDFIRQYIFESELQSFGLPTTYVQPDIMNLVELASTYIDEICGRFDGDGNGSLVYTTYTQRMLLQTRNRNLIQIPLKPIVAITAAQAAALEAQAASGNYYCTGVTPNTITKAADGTLSGIVSCYGRYGYTRQERSVGYPDLYAMINPLNLVTMFGGPAPWVEVDVSNIDYDSKTGECWLPAGLQLQAYSELIMIYNSGFDPNHLPRPVKLVCAAIVKNALAKGGGTTGLLSMSLSRSGANVAYGVDLLDSTLDRMITPFRAVRAY